MLRDVQFNPSSKPGGYPVRVLVASLVLLTLATVLRDPAAATGTARIQQADGETKTYSNVHLRIADKRMWITSHDRKGTIILDKAACTAIGKMLRCYPYEATLDQAGHHHTIVLQSGTVWINPTESMQQLPHSSTQLRPRGVLLTLRTKKGTFVSLSGTVDEVIK